MGALVAGCSGSSASSAPTSSSSPVTVTTTVTAPATTSPEGTPPAASTSAGPPRCDVPELTVTARQEGAAAGTVFYTIVFRNGGEEPCYLNGYPGVTAADAGGKGVVDAARDRARPPSRVTLGPGTAAHAELAVRNVPPGNDPCRTFPLLLVTPPDSRRTQRLSREVRPCAGEMRVTVVMPGSNGP